MLLRKGNVLLKDLRSHEQLCIEKYSKYANEASDGQLKNLFSQLGQTEKQHLQTLEQIAAGSVPQMSSQSGKQPAANFTPSANYAPQDKQKDTFLCSDMLSTEKHVSATYNTSIFEFSDSGVRSVLNHIQKEEQEHGDKIYKFMAVNGMYC